MTDYYLDPINGNDVNDGTTFANRKKTLEAFSGIAVATDTVRVIATHDPIVDIPGGAVTLPDGGEEFLRPSPALDCKALLFGYNSFASTTTTYGGTTVANATGTSTTPGSSGITDNNIYLYGSYAFTSFPQTTDTKFATITLSAAQDLSGYTKLVIWVGFGGLTNLINQTVPSVCDDDCVYIKVCSDTLGDVAEETYELKWVAPAYQGGHWYTFEGTGGGGALPSTVNSISFYTGGTNYPTGGYVAFMGAFALTSSNVLAPGDLISPKIPGANRSYWDRVCYIPDGTVANPYVYTIKEGTYETTHAEGGPYSWEVMRPINWTTLSDFDRADSWKLIGWEITNMDVSFDNLTIIGGHSPVDGSPGYGYTILDMGLNNTQLAYWMYMDTARNISFKNFISYGGRRGGFVEYGDAYENTGYAWNWEDCHINSNGIYTTAKQPGSPAGSTVKNCSFMGSNGTWTIGYQGPILFDNCVWYKIGANNHYIKDSTVTYKDCSFIAGFYIYLSLDSPYDDGNDFTFEGTNYFIGCDTKLRNLDHYTAGKTFTNMVMKGSDLDWNFGSNIVVDNLEYICGSPYKDATLALYPEINSSLPAYGGTATDMVIKNSTLIDVGSLSGGGVTFEDSTIHTKWGTYSTENTDYPGWTFRGCYVGGGTDATNTYWQIYSQPATFYNCTINRIKFRCSHPNSRLKVVGGSFLGSNFTPWDLSTTSSINRPPVYWLFHNVNFPALDVETDLAGAYGGDYYANQWHTNESGGLTLSGYDNNPTNCLIANPFWQMKTSTTQVHTAGGRSWFVDFNRYSKEIYPSHPIARVAVRGGIQLEVSMWVYQVTSGCYAYLRAEAGQVGIVQPAIRMVNANNVGVWQQVSYQFTPDMDGVMEFMISFSAPDGTHSLYVDDITFEQT